MTIVQTNSLPLPLETFTQPCAEQRKSLVEQTEEITVELLLESNDIQLFGNKLRFLVAPQNERELQQCNSFFITLCICCNTVGRKAPRTVPPDRRFAPASVSRPSAPVPRKNTKGRPESD